MNKVNKKLKLINHICWLGVGD